MGIDVDGPGERHHVGGLTVRQQESDTLQGARTEPVVDVRGLLDGVDARYQRRHVHRTVGQQIQEAGQVAALGPAHVASRVIDAVEFVAVVVSTRSVGSGKADVQLLVVIGVPRQVEPRLPDVDHPSSVPGKARCHLDRSVRVTTGGQQDVVRAQACGAVEKNSLDLAQARLVRCGTRQGTGLLRSPAPSLHHVQAHDLHAGGDEESHDELTDEPEPDHTCGLTQRDFRAPDTLHGDRAHRCECSVFGGNAVRYGDAQIGRYPIHLRVEGELVARRRHQLTDRELLRTRADLYHHAAQRVAERRVAVQPAHRLLVRG